MVPVVALVATLSGWQEPSAGSKVYKQAVPSVVWIQAGRASGSGTLVDKDRRLVLTNYHVVEAVERSGGYDPLTVYFPEFEGTTPRASRSYYESRKGELGRRGEVLAVIRAIDLAVVRLDKVPADAPEVKLAARSPSPGDPVHSVGNAGASGALWGYVRGTVRNVYGKQWQAKVGSRALKFRAKVIETDSPTNPGDSGGPLLNDAGELVGVTQGGMPSANGVSYFIDLSEVKRILTSDDVVRKAGARGAQTAAAKPKDKEPAKEPGHEHPKRPAPLHVRDDIDLFSLEATEKADKAIADLYAGGLDVLIEVHQQPPEAWRERAADPKERNKLYLDWAVERLKAEQSDGIALLVTTEPRAFRLAGGNAWLKRLPPEMFRRVEEALRKNMRENPDKALAEVLEIIKDAHATATKK